MFHKLILFSTYQSPDFFEKKNNTNESFSQHTKVRIFSKIFHKWILFSTYQSPDFFENISPIYPFLNIPVLILSRVHNILRLKIISLKMLLLSSPHFFHIETYQNQDSFARSSQIYCLNCRTSLPWMMSSVYYAVTNCRRSFPLQ